MKKLLSIIEAIGITATGASNIFSCGVGKTKTVKQPSTPQQEPIPVVEPTLQPNKPQQTTIALTPSGNENDTQIKLIEDINNEKSRKMKYFNELNNIIQKNKTELVKKIQILESKNKDLKQQQSYLKKEIQKIEQEIEQLANQQGSTGSEAVELAYKKRIKIVENNKNNKILELITNQLDENEKEIQQLNTQKDQEKFYISEINSISSPSKIIVPIKNKEKDKIYVLEENIKKIVLNQLKEKVNNNLIESDFIIEFEPKYINHTGIAAIELSHSETIKIKIHGRNNLIGTTNWINISLPAATVV